MGVRNALVKKKKRRNVKHSNVLILQQLQQLALPVVVNMATFVFCFGDMAIAAPD